MRTDWERKLIVNWERKDDVTTLAQVREHVETDLVDDALQRIIDAEDEEILKRCGPPTTQTEIVGGNATHLFLTRLISTITAISEEVDGVTTVLATDDYDIWWNQALERCSDGTHPRDVWGRRVTVVYVPQDQTSQRILTLIQLVQLAVRYNGVKHESVGSGDYSVDNYDYQHERERLFRKLEPRGGIWLA